MFSKEPRMKRYTDFVKRTAASNEFRKDCERTNEYFKFWDIQTSKQKDWTRPEYYQSRVNKQKETEQNSQREANLNRRRKNLSHMLYEENVALNEELHKMFEWNDLSDKQLKMKFDDLVAKKKEARKAEIEQLSRVNSAKSQTSLEPEMEKSDSLTLKELRHAIALEDEERKKRDEQLRLASINIEDALGRLRENEINVAALMSQEAIASKMEQELFAIDQEKVKKEKQRTEFLAPKSSYERQVVFNLRRKASQVLQEIEEDRALLQRVQKASEQASLSDDIQKEMYLKVNSLLKKMTEQAEREKRVANHCANIFQEEARNELKACEQRWQTEKAERQQQLSQVLAEWQAHARVRREAVTLERQNLEAECKALIELTRVHRDAGKAMYNLKNTIVKQLGEKGEAGLEKE
ncbi:trichoplein keratin filament-binding protein [Neocloeon triangulifer]|uniref:trichoplein keratin filament-binding protein n=1 Tax=Neocloeon triangulifer TaxID=2078957 RepID=UPI00286EDC15|nr:trichoplein keratin filament-binding protein [Neocloeon triangulifer]